MALTRAQLLAGNQSQGIVLPGQVQAVTAGAGVDIDANGVLSLDGSDPAFNGFIKTNNQFAFNAYVWPGVDGTADQFLQTDGSGNLTWADASGFAVVTVSNIQPTPPDEGELWYDCNTGYLKVYQNCVAPGGWTNVAEPGKPVLPANTSAFPNFTGGNGTLATPFDCTVTTAAVGSSVFIINTVTITGLAPYQYVPIIDLNAVANGGRFSFSNYYANAGGTLIFQTIFKDQPASPPLTSYTAAIKVGYGTVYIDAIVNIVTPVSLTSPGTISGTPQVGDTLTYTPGTAVNGVPAYTYTWEWKKLSDGSILQSGSGTTPQTYVIPATLIGDNIYVELKVTDSIGGTDTGVTSLVPTPPATIQRGPFPATPINFPTTIPGTANTTWNEPGTTSITSNGCLKFSVNGVNQNQGPANITLNDTLTTEWIVSPACGGANSGTTIQGCIVSASYEECSSLPINRIPGTFPTFTANTNVALGAVSTSNTVTPSGYNSTAYVTLGAASTGTSIQGSLDGGGTWFNIPAAGSTAFPINPGQTLTVKQTVGTTVNTGYTAIINIGDSTGSTSQTFTATTVLTAVFPNFTTTPAGGPNASPAITSLSGPSLYGTAVGAAWADGSLNLTATGSLQYKIGAGAFTQGSNPVINGNVVSLAWNPTAAVTTHGTVLTGDLLGGPYTNTYSLTVANQPAAYTWTDVPKGAGGSAISTLNTSNVVNITGINAPAQLIYTPDPTDPLTSVEAAINGGAWTAIPTTGTGLTINPADTAGTTATTLQIRGITGPNLNTDYKITTKIGDGTTWVTDEWSVGTVAATPAVQAPNIVTPSAGSTNVGTASGITITAGAYTPSGGAGLTQASSTWEVYKTTSYTTTAAVTGVNTNTITANYQIVPALSPGTNVNVTVTSNQITYDVTIPGTGAIGVQFNSPQYSPLSLTTNYVTGSNNTQAVVIGPGPSTNNIPLSGTQTINPTMYGPGSYFIKTEFNGVSAFNKTIITFNDFTFVQGGTQTVLTVDNSTNWLSLLTVGATLTGDGGQTLTVGAVNTGTSTVTSTTNGFTGSWTTSTVITGVTAPPPTGAPTSDPPGPGYTAITGSPFTVSTGTLTALTIAKPPLEANTKYWVRAQYTSTAITTTSPFGGWSDFTTGDLAITGTMALWGQFTGDYFKGSIAYDGTSNYYTASQGNLGSSAYGTSNGTTWNSTNAYASGSYQLYKLATQYFNDANTLYFLSANGAFGASTSYPGGTSSSGKAIVRGSELVIYYMTNANADINFIYSNDSGSSFVNAGSLAGAGVPAGNNSGYGRGTYFNGVWIMPCGKGVVYTTSSTPTSGWTAVTFGANTTSSAATNAVASSSTLALTVNQPTRTVYTSSDGINWSPTSLTLPAGSQYFDINFVGGAFIIGAYSAGANPLVFKVNASATSITQLTNPATGTTSGAATGISAYLPTGQVLVTVQDYSGGATARNQVWSIT